MYRKESAYPTCLSPLYFFFFFIIFNIFGLCSSFLIIREECSPPPPAQKDSSRDLYVRHAAAEHRYVYKCVSECVYRRHKSSVEERERDWSLLFYLYETTSGSLNQSKAFGRGILSTLRVMLAQLLYRRRYSSAVYNSTQTNRSTDMELVKIEANDPCIALLPSRYPLVVVVGKWSNHHLFYSFSLFPIEEKRMHSPYAIIYS